MSPETPTPLPLRPSEAERERIARVLRDSSVDGRISMDTFSGRLERTFAARRQGELDELVADLRRPGPLHRAWLWALAAWERPQVEALALPAQSETPVVLGRARECDCVVADPAVSRRHAELRREDERWFLRDLGSRNGTRVNGVRLLEEAEVRPGDRVSLAEVRFRLALPPD